ncbi:hypothetical protein V7201_17810 [Bacillus sp. JJ1122]
MFNRYENDNIHYEIIDNRYGSCNNRYDFYDNRYLFQLVEKDMPPSVNMLILPNSVQMIC